MTPVSTRPTGTVPMPPILQTSWSGRRRGLSVGREGGTMESRASMRVKPLASPFSLVVLAQPFSSMPSRDGAEDTLFGIVTNLLDVTLDFLADFQEARLAVGSRSGAVHLVDTNNELLDTQGVGEEGVLTGLA